MAFEVHCSRVWILMRTQPPGFRTLKHSAINLLVIGKSVVPGKSKWWITKKRERERERERGGGNGCGEKMGYVINLVLVWTSPLVKMP